MRITHDKHKPDMHKMYCKHARITDISKPLPCMHKTEISLDLISFTKYLCSFVSQGKACCTFNILCRFMYYQGLQSNSGILLALLEKLIFLHLSMVHAWLKLFKESISGCLRITAVSSSKLSSFSLKVLSEI